MRYLLRASAVLVFTFIVSFYPSVVLACSGPGARALTEGNTHLSVQLFALGCFLVVATAALYFFRRKRSSLILAIVAAIILAVHPVWTISAMAGDCGAFKASASMDATGLLGILFLAQLALVLFTFVFRRRT
jgi:hypothetical protein